LRLRAVNCGQAAKKIARRRSAGSATRTSSADKYASAELVAEEVASQWFGNGTSKRFVVITGGEPLLQLDQGLIDRLHGLGFEIAIETNGTIAAPGTRLDLCEPQSRLVALATKWRRVKGGVPAERDDAGGLRTARFDHFFVQPMDGPDVEQNTELAARYCLEHPAGGQPPDAQAPGIR